VVRELVNLSHSAYIHSLLFVCAFPAATLLLFLLVQATQILGRDAKRSTAHLGIPERCSDRPILTLPIRLRARTPFFLYNEPLEFHNILLLHLFGFFLFRS
jgi:hypothetical protein